MVYLIHFDYPFKHARHYIGFVHPGNLEKRMEHHRAGTGARIMRAVTNAGIGWSVVRTWEDAGPEWERHLKNMHGPASFCPVCNPEHALNRQKGPKQ